MGSTLNMVYSGGGLYPVLAVTITNGTATSVTATLNSTVVNLTYDSVAGVWRGTLKAFGVWTVEASNGEKTVSDTVDVTNVAVYQLSFSFPRLPNGYTELEYIEGNKSQFITVANFQYKNSLNYHVKVYFDTVPSSSTVSFNHAFMFKNSADTANVRIYVTDAKIYIEQGAEYSQSASPGEYDVLISGSGEGRTILINNSSVGGFTVDLERINYLNSTASLYIGTASETTVSTHGLDGKLYILTFYDGEETYRDFVPAKRNADGVVGVFELITGTFYLPSQGTFIAGPEVTQLAA